MLRALIALLVLSVALAIVRVLDADSDVLNLLAEATHCAGAFFLLVQLLRCSTCAGISLKAQELVVIYLGCRTVCSVLMEWNSHTVVDSMTLLVCAATLCVLRTQKRIVRETDERPYDTFNQALLLVPSLCLAVLVHPPAPFSRVLRIVWAFGLYLEAVSIVPQLYMLRKRGDRALEPYLASYLLFLGVSRTFALFHWVFQFLDNRFMLMQLLHGHVWIYAVLFTEVVSTLMLSDFVVTYLRKLYHGEASAIKPSEVDSWAEVVV